jgi:hypothetical protein
MCKAMQTAVAYSNDGMHLLYSTDSHGALETQKYWHAVESQIALK